MRVLIIGAGGLGSPVALALAADGPARPSLLTLVDGDSVELSNLHRQTLHGERDLGRRKVDSGADRLARLSPALRVERVAEPLSAASAATLLSAHDLVIEGSDDLLTKFLVNDAALRAGIPAIIGGVVRWSGQILTVVPARSGTPRHACYRCLFEAPPPPGTAQSCQQAGVLGPACGVVGGTMALEAQRLLRGAAPRFAGTIWTADLLRGRFRAVPVGVRPGCTGCGAPAFAGGRQARADE